jgi:hypothetical protein
MVRLTNAWCLTSSSSHQRKKMPKPKIHIACHFRYQAVAMMPARIITLMMTFALVMWDASEPIFALVVLGDCRDADAPPEILQHLDVPVLPPVVESVLPAVELEFFDDLGKEIIAVLSFLVPDGDLADFFPERNARKTKQGSTEDWAAGNGHQFCTVQTAGGSTSDRLDQGHEPENGAGSF